MGVMTEGEFLPLIARPYRDAADRARWNKVFRELRAEDEDEAEREALRAKLENWVGSYALARGIGQDYEAAERWLKSMRKHTREMLKLLRAVPFPFDENSDLFDAFVPDEPSPALVMLERIEKELTYEPSPPRPAHRPKADYSDLEELVRRVAPIYHDRTGKSPAATPGPFMRMMRALLIVADDRPVDHAIRTAIRAYMEKSNRR